MCPRGGKDEGAAATRSALIAHARELFADRGYGGVSVDEIVQATRVTKGALYHHFKDKKAVFRAVAEQVEQELLGVVTDAAPGEADPWVALRAAALAYLDACTRPDVGRIVVLDAPGVLGWKGWCDLQQQYGVAALVARLRKVVDAGSMDDQPLEPVAQMVLGAIDVGARVIVEADRPARARREVVQTLERLLAGLARQSSAT